MFPTQEDFLKFPRDMEVTSIGLGYSNLSLAMRDSKLNDVIYKLDKKRELNIIFQNV